MSALDVDETVANCSPPKVRTVEEIAFVDINELASIEASTPKPPGNSARAQGHLARIEASTTMRARRSASPTI